MLEILLTTLKSYFIIVDSVMKMIQYANEYREYVVNAVVIVVAFLIGKAIRAPNQFDQYLLQFGSSSKNEDFLQAKIAWNARFARFFSLAFAVLGSGIFFFWVYRNRSILLSERFSLDLLISEHKRHKANYYLFTGLCLGLTVLFIVRKYFAFLQQNLAEQLERASSNKYLYVEKFFSIVGKEMKEELRKVLLKNSGPLPLKSDLISGENERTKGKIKSLYIELDRCERAELAYRKFAFAVSEFDWCIKCFEESSKTRTLHFLDEELEEIFAVKKPKKKQTDARLPSIALGLENKLKEHEMKEKCEIKQSHLNVGRHLKAKKSQETKTRMIGELQPNRVGNNSINFLGCDRNCLLRFYLQTKKAASEAKDELEALGVAL